MGNWSTVMLDIEEFHTVDGPDAQKNLKAINTWLVNHQHGGTEYVGILSMHVFVFKNFVHGYREEFYRFLLTLPFIGEVRVYHKNETQGEDKFDCTVIENHEVKEYWYPNLLEKRK